jgi:uncharacterized protein involved in exopolysaccharide biosynthesis
MADKILEEEPLPWRELIETLFRRKTVVLVTLLLGLAAGLLVIATKRPVYLAEARILLTANAVAGPRETAMSDRQISAELTLLRSSTLLRSVLEKLPEPEIGGGVLERLGDWTRGAFGALSLSGDERSASPAERELDNIARSIVSEPVGGSNVVEVAFPHADPEWAATFVNVLLETHVQRISQLAVATTPRGFFGEQRHLLAERWEKASAALSAYRAEHGLLAGEETELRRVIADLEAGRVAADTEVLELQAKAGFLAEELRRYPAQVASESTTTEDESVTFLRSRILELEMERSEQLSRFTPTSTVIRELNRQIEQATRLLTAKQGATSSETTTALNPAYQALEVESVQTRSRLTAAQVRLTALTAQIERYRDHLRELEASAGELARLENEVDAAREVHQSYMRQEEEARFSSALDESGIVNVSIIEHASVPTSPEPTRNRLTLLAFAAGALLLGVLLAYLINWIDPHVSSASQAGRLTDLPVLAELPPSG